MDNPNDTLIHIDIKDIVPQGPDVDQYVQGLKTLGPFVMTFEWRCPHLFIEDTRRRDDVRTWRCIWCEVWKAGPR